MRYPSDAKQPEYQKRYREKHGDRIRAAARESARARTAKMTPEERWARWLWRCHKLTPYEYEKIWAEQDGRCYLCERELERGKTHLDHDHACCREGRSCVFCRRGLACRGCNWILGWCGEDPAILRRIADKLESLPR